MNAHPDALFCEVRPGRHETATSHVLAADGTPAAAVDAPLVAALLRARLAQIEGPLAP